MIGLIFTLTLGQLLRQRRVLLLGLLAAIPVAITLLFRFTSSRADTGLPEFVASMLDALVVSIGLPLTALVLGTAALGQEIEDGTAFYLLSKPIARWQIVVAKLMAAWVATSIFVTVSTLGSAAPLIGERGEDMLVPAFVIAGIVGSLGYTTLFLALSIRFNHALVIGLSYVFLWEGLASSLFKIDGVRFLSLRAYTLGIAGAVSEAPSTVFSARLDGPSASVLATILIVGAFIYAVRRLERYELSERV
ncbi:MAG: ABC transporter permease subunit [Dehalococcoidia bacterium]